ncbi:MAG: DNA-deoxyinosine glycosylase [Alphaproteobacteria bacterium]|nr:DNA-deoxyinosine glycosylase [Alphaproteobacteria bacterium]
MRACGFPPIAGRKARVLILGSMPGVPSLRAQEYYAHKPNMFWKIMGALFDMPVGTYAQKTALIKNNRLALWDVLKECERKGSSDAKIRNAERNDFTALLKKHPGITHIVFNGKRAELEFVRHVLPQLKNGKRFIFKPLPSTSPLNARASFEAKLKAWRYIPGVLQKT